MKSSALVLFLALILSTTVNAYWIDWGTDGNILKINRISHSGSFYDVEFVTGDIIAIGEDEFDIASIFYVSGDFLPPAIYGDISFFYQLETILQNESFLDDPYYHSPLPATIGPNSNIRFEMPYVSPLNDEFYMLTSFDAGYLHFWNWMGADRHFFVGNYFDQPLAIVSISPIPEPSTLLLLSAVLGGYISRRKLFKPNKSKGLPHSVCSTYKDFDLTAASRPLP